MIIGAHSILYSKSPAADRAFLRDILGFPSVDAGDGPAAESSASTSRGTPGRSR